MKRIILGATLLFTTLLFATGLSAQTYFQDDFSGTITAHWTLTDSDGDGNNWAIYDSQDPTQGNVANSASYLNNPSGGGGNPLTPNNWMVSEAIDLSAATGNIFLSWEAQAQDQNYPNENYSVYVSSSNNIATMQTGGAAFTEVIGATNGAYVARSVDLSSFMGQTIYVAFRHYNVSDEFALNIDNVSVAKIADADLELTNIDPDNLIMGNRTFSIDVTNTGANVITSFDLNWKYNGGAATTVNVTGINLTHGQKYTVSVPITGVTIGSKTFYAEITTSDDVSTNNSKTKSFTFVVPVIQFTSTDSEGNPFDLYEHLQSGQAIVLDFMASWCGPCQSSTPAISQFIQNNGSGNGKVQALAITVEPTDDASVLNGLGWNGGYYEYPKFPYTSANNSQYYHYAKNHRFNAGGGIPFFVMICPNITDPKMSTIIEHDVGYGTGMFNPYQAALDQCIAHLGLINFPDEEINFKLYPNPTSGLINVDFNLKNENKVTVSILNTVGQTVASKNREGVTGEQTMQFNTSNLEAGMYFVKVKTENGEQVKRISVVK